MSQEPAAVVASVASAIVGAVVLLFMVPEVFPVFLDASRDLRGAFLNPGTGNPLIDGLGPVLALRLPGALSFIALVLGLVVALFVGQD